MSSKSSARSGLVHVVTPCLAGDVNQARDFVIPRVRPSCQTPPDAEVSCHVSRLQPVVVPPIIDCADCVAQREISPQKATWHMSSEEASRKKKYSGTERRASKRYPSAVYLNYDIQVTPKEYSEGGKLVPIENLSVTGMRVLARNHIPPGRIVRVQFVTPERLAFIPRKFRPECQVVWAKRRPPQEGGVQMGLKFLDQDYKSQHVFGKLIEYSVKRFRHDTWNGATERRQAHRQASNITCNYKIEPIPFLAMGGERDCPVRNWSVSGMRIRTRKPLKVGDSLRIRFNIPSKVHSMPRNFSVRAKVVWVTGRPSGHGFRAGCKFVGLSNKAREELNRATIDVLITVHGYA